LFKDFRDFPTLPRGFFFSINHLLSSKKNLTFRKIRERRPSNMGFEEAFVSALMLSICLASSTEAFTPPSTSPYDAAAQKAIIDLHNKHRMAITKATNMAKIAWDDGLASTAQYTAALCTFEHTSPDWITQVTGPDGKTLPAYVGQNLFKGTAGAFDYTSAINAWHAEVKDYDYCENKCAAGKVCGHYTQVVWATTAHVGCGMATCGGSVIIACDYYKPGNYRGVDPYKMSDADKKAMCTKADGGGDRNLAVKIIVPTVGAIVVVATVTTLLIVFLT